MPLQGATQEINTFVKGIITEATAINFPPNASIDEQNFDLNRNGSRRRRFGMDYEIDFAKIDTGFDPLAIASAGVNVFLWDNVENENITHFAVVQIRDKLWFLDRYAATLSIAIKNGGNALTIPNVRNEDLEAVSISGKLVLTGRYKDPSYLSYNSTTDTVTETIITTQVRDFWGVDDGLAVDERPATETAKHTYNLYNQGWTDENIALVTATTTPPVTTPVTPDGLAVWPSNADLMQYAKNSEDVFAASLLDKQYFGGTPAPKGRYVISPFTRGPSRETAAAGNALPLAGLLPPDVDTERCALGTSYAGRMFYAGVRSDTSNGDSRSPNISSMIFFSRVIEGVNDFGKCYQEADPTSEHISDIIDNDGGFVVIPEANHVVKLITLGSSLVVLADNGIWEIFGDTGGFIATSYQVSKVSNIGAVGRKSIIEAEDTVLYWGEGGIYTLAVDPTSARVVGTNITEGSIQTLYNTFPGPTKEYAKGCFDESNRKISWLYNDSATYTGTNYRYKYNKELVLDFALKAFYIKSIKELATDSPYIAGCLPLPSFVDTVDTQGVEVNGTAVEVNADSVNVATRILGGAVSSTKYLTMVPAAGGNYTFTFSAYKNVDFLDWYSEDSVGIDAAAYMQTGQDVYGDTQRNKQAPYITFHFIRTETGFRQVGNDLLAIGESSCLVQARWDFSDHTNSGKYGSQFQAYRLRRNYIPTGTSDAFDYGHSVITTKSKLRGKGRALSLYLSTEAGKDCHILGWGLSVTQAQSV